MKILKVLCTLFLVLTVTTVHASHRGDESIYVMGASFCFGDSVVYFTEIQQMEGVRLTREGFLPNREGYSTQLKNYLQTLVPNQNHTSVTYFSKKKSKLQKKLYKLLKRYQAADASTVVRYIPLSDFKYVIDQYY